MSKKKHEDGKYENESAEQREAFEFYYSLGDSRNLEKVGEYVGKSTRTMYEWSRRFNWGDRVVQYDIEVNKKLQAKTINTVVDEKANYRKIIKLAINDFVKNLRDGNLKVTSVSDLEKLMKLDLTLMGEATEISENKNTNTHALTEEDRKLVQGLAEGFKADLENDDD